MVIMKYFVSHFMKSQEKAVHLFVHGLFMYICIKKYPGITDLKQGYRNN